MVPQCVYLQLQINLGFANEFEHKTFVQATARVPCSIEESEEQLTEAGLTQEIVVPFPVESVLSGKALLDSAVLGHGLC